jgi:hypothetical protein
LSAVVAISSVSDLPQDEMCRAEFDDDDDDDDHDEVVGV